MGIKNAYLVSELEEKIYMTLSEGAILYSGSIKGSQYCRFRKSLYGLKQSARVWQKRMAAYLLGKVGF